MPAKSLQLSWSHVWLLVLTGWPQRRHIAQDGAEVNAQDMEGNTPFDWADDYGHGECAVLLWRRGAQIKTQTGKRTYISLGQPIQRLAAPVYDGSRFSSVQRPCNGDGRGEVVSGPPCGE